MSKIAIVYGSSTGATVALQRKIQAALGDAKLFNADGVSVDDLQSYDFLS